MASYRKYCGTSKFFRTKDITAPILLTETFVKEKNVAKDGEPEKIRLAAYFHESLKALVLNTSNCEVLAELAGTDEIEDWKDIPVELYVDPDVRYGGKRVGGIKLRQPEAKAY